MATRTIRTTLSLPIELLERIDRAVHEGQVRSRNALLETALRHELAAMEDAAIDAQLLGMAQDADYQAEALALAEEFGTAEWQVLTDTEAKT